MRQANPADEMFGLSNVIRNVRVSFLLTLNFLPLLRGRERQ